VQGSITKTRNTHARRLLIEAAWQHRPAYRPAKTMRDRWSLAPAAVRARGDAGNRRLHERWVAFNLRRKTAGDSQRRRRPRTGRLVLVPGHHGLTRQADLVAEPRCRQREEPPARQL
jgi:hypothetical protein